MTEKEVINPIHPEYVPRLSETFVKLYNENAAIRLASHQVPIEESRANPTKYSFAYGTAPAPKVARKTDYTIPVPAGGNVKLRIYESEQILNEDNRPVYVNYHGGGWVFGGFVTDSRFCSHVCNRVGCVVVDVEYRLAPEHPWPSHIQDSWAAFLWVRDNAELLRIDPLNVAIGGCSAGGHLAAVVAQRCLAKKIPLKLQILTVPATDLSSLADDYSIRPDCPYNSYLENASAPCLPLERMQFFMKHFLGEKMPHPPPAANPAILPPKVELSPMKATSLKGLAPAMINTADVDVLRDDGEAYARKLSENGVPVKLKRYMGVPHPWMVMDGALEEARDYIQDCCDQLKIAFGR